MQDGFISRNHCRIWVPFWKWKYTLFRAKKLNLRPKPGSLCTTSLLLAG
ncbi:hypothetical protein IM797_22580 [Pedobacter sp. MC2016-24]|nr:hypothetical protein [Pedobacter sp. MC2016-24]